MIDSKLAGTGNSRFLKSVSNFKTLYPTYDDFVSALIAGTLPIDLNGINPDGWTQQGTPLNKANLLSDDVANGLGLVDDATPNGAFNAIISAKGKSNGFATLDSSGKVPSGQLNLSSSVASTSTTTVANSNAVKSAYDKANSAYTLASGKPSVTTGSVALSRHLGYPEPTASGEWVRIGNVVQVDLRIDPGSIKGLGLTNLIFKISGLPAQKYGNVVNCLTYVGISICACQIDLNAGFITVKNIEASEISGAFDVKFSYIAA